VTTGEDEEEDDDDDEEEDEEGFFSGFASTLLTSSCSAFSSVFFDSFKVSVSTRASSVFVLREESLPGETIPLSAARGDVPGLAPRLCALVFFETVTDVPMGVLAAFLDGSLKRRVCRMEIDVMQEHTVDHIASCWYGESKRAKGNKPRMEKIIRIRMQIAIATRSFVIRTIVFLDFCCFTLSELDWRKN